MLNRLHRISTFLIVALGMVHLGFTPYYDDGWTLDALWFAGSGFAIIFAGFLNLIATSEVGKHRLVWALCLTVDLISTALFTAALILLREPQVFVGIFLMLVATIATLLRRRRLLVPPATERDEG